MKRIVSAFALAVTFMSCQKAVNLAHVYGERAQVRYQKLMTSAKLPKQVAVSSPLRIAHAGGEIDGQSLTNSLEAIEQSYARGFRVFEIDLNFTNDGEIACIHDWGKTSERLLGSSGSRSAKEFMGWKLLGQYTPMTLATLAQWLKAHPDAFVVTDAKDDNLKVLRKIAEGFGDIRPQIIPQAYFAREVIPIYELGFERVILTLYRSSYRAKDLLAHLSQVPVFAVTMPEHLGRGELPGLLRELQVSSYVHTVNSEKALEELRALGVLGIYTDRLAPVGVDSLKRP